jgi:hypothetical protein
MLRIMTLMNNGKILSICSVAQPAQQFSPAMQIQNYYHYSFLWKLIVFTVNEHKNICIGELNSRAGHAIVFVNQLGTNLMALKSLV